MRQPEDADGVGLDAGFGGGEFEGLQGDGGGIVLVAELLGFVLDGLVQFFHLLVQCHQLGFGGSGFLAFAHDAAGGGDGATLHETAHRSHLALSAKERAENARADAHGGGEFGAAGLLLLRVQLELGFRGFGFEGLHGLGGFLAQFFDGFVTQFAGGLGDAGFEFIHLLAGV